MDRDLKNRRGFLVSGIYGLWALIVAGLAGPAAAYLLIPRHSRKEAAWVEVGEVNELSVNVPEKLVFRQNRRDGWKVTSEKSTVWVVKRDDTDLAAFRPECTHLGCAYHWDAENNEFLCPCHTSTFDMEGKVLAGPAPRPLDRYQIRIEDGKLLLGVSEPPAGRA